MRENVRANKKFTIIKLPAKKTPEVKHLRCVVHKAVRMVDVGEDSPRCPLCGNNTAAEDKEEDIRFSNFV